MPSSDTTRILRIPRSDEQNAYVLVHVSRSNPATLDLKLAATEGENPYVGSVRQSRLKNLRAKSYQGSDGDWLQILSYVFFGQSSETVDHSDTISGVETLASIRSSGDEDQEIVITIRKRIESITQRLGSVTLKQDDEQAIELFDWSGVAVARADSFEQQISSLNDRCRVAEDTIRKLSAQFEELVLAKTQHEIQLTASFVQLLNEKKLKIRNQQRLLVSATVDPAKVSDMQTRVSDGVRSTAGKSRSAKRNASQLSDTASDSSDGGFERMEVDKTKDDGVAEDNQETDDGERSTPQPLEDEDNTTDDEDVDLQPAEQRREKDTQTRGPTTSTGSSVEHPIRKEPSSPPPKRELPFLRRTQTRDNTAHQAEEKPSGAAEDIDDDDDEL